MADDREDAAQDTVEVNSSEGKSRGGLPKFVIKILQLIAAAVAIIVLMIVIAYFVSNTVMNQRAITSYPINSGNVTTKPEPLAWYDNLEEVRVLTRDNPPKQLIMNVSLGYEENNAVVQNELIKQRIPLQDLVRQYLSQRTAKELANEAQLKSELKAAINNMMRRGEVKQIAFTSLNLVDY